MRRSNKLMTVCPLPVTEKHSNVANCRDGGGMTQDTTGLVMMAEFFSTRSGFFDFMEDQIVAVSIGMRCRR